MLNVVYIYIYICILNVFGLWIDIYILLRMNWEVYYLCDIGLGTYIYICILNVIGLWIDIYILLRMTCEV